MMNSFTFRRHKCKKEIEIKINAILLEHTQFYLFGLTEITEIIIKFLKDRNKQIIGIISDDFKPSKLPIPIIQINEAERKIPIINCALLRVSQSNKLLKRLKFDIIIDYFEFNLFDEVLFAFPYIDNNYIDIKTNFHKYQWLYEKLEDTLSKEIFERVLDMRYNNKLSPILKQNVANQYFDVISHYNNINVFVDCGGYHGESTKCFISRNPNYKTIYFFEPFPDAMDIAKNELRNYDIRYKQLAVYDKEEQVSLTGNSEEGNAISLHGDIIIGTCAMDNVIVENVDFIKLDIEGSELEALHGAEKIIKKYQPIIAVAVYHKQTHFWEISEYLLALMPESRFYLRHYNDGVYDTILHIIPERFYNNLLN